MMDFLRQGRLNPELRRSYQERQRRQPKVRAKRKKVNRSSPSVVVRPPPYTDRKLVHGEIATIIERHQLVTLVRTERPVRRLLNERDEYVNLQPIASSHDAGARPQAQQPDRRQVQTN